MNAHNTETDRQRCAAALRIWENEGGASGRHFTNRQYGCRVEADRSWTVYHVFSGIPAHEDGVALTGLSRSDATRAMLSLNLRTAERRKARVAAPAIVCTAQERANHDASPFPTPAAASMKRAMPYVARCAIALAVHKSCFADSTAMRGGRELGLPRPFCAFVPNLSTAKAQVCKLMVFELGQLFALAVKLDPARYRHHRSCNIAGDVTDVCWQ